MRQLLRPSGGFLLITSLFVILAILSFVSIGLTRSMTDLHVTNRLMAGTQAFHTAEAGLDGYLTFLRSSVAGEINTILNSLPKTNLPCGDVPDCTILEVSDDPDDADPSRDSNKMIVIRVRGLVGHVPRTIQAVLYVDTSNPVVYPYSVAGKTINMDGNSTFGDPLEWNKATIYAQGPPDSNGSIITTGNNDVWVGHIDFYNPTNASLAALCHGCSDPTTFHPEPFTSTPPTFSTNAPKAPDLQIDLRPYYDQAVVEGHVISTTPAKAFKNTTLTGVYYVECGVTIQFDGVVTVNGTIVHEGCDGALQLLPNAELTIDSTAGTQPFSPGMSIIGAPTLLFNHTANVNITGLVMGLGGDVTNMKAHGTIHGSLLAVEDGGRTHADLVSSPGPGSESPITFPLSELRVENAHIVFSAIAGSGGSTVASGVVAELRAWMQDDIPP